MSKKGISPNVNFLAAFVALPKKLKFANQQKDEKIILLLRRHWITNLPWCLILLLFLFSPLFLFNFPFLEFIPSRFRLMALLIWFLVCFGFALEKFLSWFYNVYLITDERVIDVDFYSLFYREISEAKIDKIQDITSKSGGLIRSVFNFGDIFVQTASQTQQIEFEAVPKPQLVVEVLNYLLDEEEKEKLKGKTR